MVNRVWNDNVKYIQHHYMMSNKTDTDFWKYYNKFDCGQTVWDNYNKNSSRYTNLYPDSIWATLATYYDQFDYYEVK